MQAPAQPLGSHTPSALWIQCGKHGHGNRQHCQAASRPRSLKIPSNQLGPAECKYSRRTTSAGNNDARAHKQQSVCSTDPICSSGWHEPCYSHVHDADAQPSAQNFATMNAPAQSNQPPIGRMLDDPGPRSYRPHGRRHAPQAPAVTRPDLRGLRAMAPSSAPA